MIENYLPPVLLPDAGLSDMVTVVGDKEKDEVKEYVISVSGEIVHNQPNHKVHPSRTSMRYILYNLSVVCYNNFP